MEEVDNPMLKPLPGELDYPYQPPCRGETLTFREYLLEYYTLKELLNEPGVVSALLMVKGDEYEEWRRS